ncbi:MAG: hypothetical protein P8X74_07335 [Reinekea sp.]|jgi:hypothetical protein
MSNETSNNETSNNETSNNETGVVRLQGLEDFIQHSVELITPVLRQINILTPDFNADWLGAGEFVEQLKLCIVRNRRVKVRLLLVDPISGIRQNHPLIPLIKRLSRFEARVITREFADKQPLKNAQLLVDLGGVLVRQSFSDYVGFVHYDDKHTVKNLLEDYEQYWRFSTVHADLRHLYI